MKSQLIKYTLGVGILGSGLFFFQNCAPTKFADNGGNESIKVCAEGDTKCLNPQSTPTPGSSPTPSGTPGSTPTPSGSPTPTPSPTPAPTATPADPFPKMTVSAPPCNANSMCPVTFAIDKAYAKALNFDWRTYDDGYLTNPAYARPNIDYVPKSGNINFAPGQTSVVIQIQSLNINMTTRIPFQWFNCKFGGTALDCNALK